MSDDRGGVPHPPYDELRKRIGSDRDALQALDALRQHLEGPHQERATVEHHVDLLRRVRTLEAIIANWWDDPITQRWIKGITDAGL